MSGFYIMLFANSVCEKVYHFFISRHPAQISPLVFVQVYKTASGGVKTSNFLDKTRKSCYNINTKNQRHESALCTLTWGTEGTFLSCFNTIL